MADNKHKKISRYEKELIKEKDKEYSYEIILKKERRKKVIKFLNKYNSDKILEIGCGLEPLFMDFKDFETYTIIEPSNKFYQNAIKIRDENFFEKNIKIYKAFVEDIYNKFDNFDFIIFSSVLHEVPNKEEIMSAISELCNERTTVHINVPNVRSLHNLIGYEMGLLNDLFEFSETDKRYERHNKFDLNSLKEFVKHYNFKVIDSGSYFLKPFTNKQMESMILQNIIDEEVLLGLKKVGKYFPENGSEIFINAKKK